MRPMGTLTVLAEVPTWLYVGSCVLLPLAWGLATEFLFRWLSRRRTRRRDGKEGHSLTDSHV